MMRAEFEATQRWLQELDKYFTAHERQTLCIARERLRIALQTEDMNLIQEVAAAETKVTFVAASAAEDRQEAELTRLKHKPDVPPDEDGGAGFPVSSQPPRAPLSGSAAQPLPEPSPPEP